MEEDTENLPRAHATKKLVIVKKTSFEEIIGTESRKL